jgi:hypothetical protein
MRFSVTNHFLVTALLLSACGEIRESGESTAENAHELTRGDAAMVDASADAGVPGETVPATPTSPLVGHYGLRLVVSSKTNVLGMTMKSVTTTLGLVDISEHDARLVWSQRGCRATSVNDPSTSVISAADSVIRSAPALVSELHVTGSGDSLAWERPDASIGVGFHDDDTSLALPTNLSDARVFDSDGDGHPGATSHVKTRVLFSNIEGDVYFVQRVRSSLSGSIVNGRLVGTAVDHSEANALDATNVFLKVPLKPVQDPSGDNSVVLVPLASELSCDELVAQASTLF